ncbi:MAG: hypothetical protein ACI4I9_06590 [Porcipelethomonas sp.]
MGPFEYRIIKIEGEYATLERTDIQSADTVFVALALLPAGCDVGTELRWENLEYSVINR